VYFCTMEKFKWTPRKRRAAYLMACEPMKYKEIAAKLNITEQTLWNYRQHGEFNRKVGQLEARENRMMIETQVAIRFNLLK
jgi:transposase-like protein